MSQTEIQNPFSSLIEELTKFFSIATIQKFLIENNYPPIDYVSSFKIVEIAENDAKRMLSLTKNEIEKTFIRAELKDLVENCRSTNLYKFEFENIVVSRCSNSFKILCDAIADTVEKVLEENEGKPSKTNYKNPRGEFKSRLSKNEISLLFDSLRRHGFIYPTISNQKLALIISQLTGYSENTVGDALGGSEIIDLRLDIKTKNILKENLHYLVDSL